MLFGIIQNGKRVVQALFTLVLCCAPTVQAQVTFDWATVGNPGNAPNVVRFNRIGDVAYAYQISKTEVTNAQYAEFLNAAASADDPYGLYNLSMSRAMIGRSFQSSSSTFVYTPVAGNENKPVAYVSVRDAMRFTNWLHNGQGGGDTEDGAYPVLGGNVLVPSRRSDARYFIPTQHEWYKAAYHDSSAGTAGDYFLFATGSNTAPVSDKPDEDPSAVNYFNNDGIDNGFNDGYAVTGLPTFDTQANYYTDVGAFSQAVSPYGTFDQSGNVREWTESSVGSQYYIYGGAYNNSGSQFIQSTEWVFGQPTRHEDGLGFRVARPVALLGDLNGDSLISASDISAFVQALTDPGGFAAAYPSVVVDEVGDFNDDGQLTNLDIAGFVELLSVDAQALAVPEPSSLVFFGLGLTLGLRRRR